MGTLPTTPDPPLNRPLPLLILALGIAIAGAGLFLVLLLAPAEPPAELTAPPTRAITKQGPASRAHPPRHDGGPPPPGASAPGPGRSGSAASSPRGSDDYGKPAPLGQDEPSDGDEQGGGDPDPTVWPTSSEGIKGAIAESLPRIRRCYEQALAADPDMGGTITVAFTIGTTDTASGVGTVLDAGIADATIEQTTMDDCLLDAMESLQFDPPVEGEIEINYPFTFSAE